jgi:hypothetical protein
VIPRIAHCADISYDHARVKRCEQVFLRVGKGVVATQFVGFVDVEGKPARHLFSTHDEARDFGTASGLTLPGRVDTPVGYTLGWVLLDTGAQRQEIIYVDAVDDVGFDSFYSCTHDTSPFLR